MIHTQTTTPNHIALRAGKKRRVLYGVGALVSVFEKSATELKLKTKITKMQKHNTNGDIQR